MRIREKGNTPQFFVNYREILFFKSTSYVVTIIVNNCKMVRRQCLCYKASGPPHQAADPVLSGTRALSSGTTHLSSGIQP